MKLKVFLNIGMVSLLPYMAGFVSFAHAEDYVAQSQVNAANGVAGLNADKEVTADIKNNNITTEKMLIRNNPVVTGYDKEDSYDIDSSKLYSPPIQGGYEIRSPYTKKAIVDKAGDAIKDTDGNPIIDYPDSSLIFLSQKYYDNINVRPNTLMLGGQSRNAIVGLKGSCQNTSGGDNGGSCYQFTDMGGAQGGRRSGAGGTDGVNIDARSADSSPIDVIGGNQLIKGDDGNYSVKGVVFPVNENADAGANSFKVKGIFGCGVQDETLGITNVTLKKGTSSSYWPYGCVMTGIDVLDSNEKTITMVNVTPGQYDPETGTTTVQLPASFKLKKSLSTSNSVEIKMYSADGKAYGIKYTSFGAIIYPTLSLEEKNLIHPRMAIWTNIANGMDSTEGSREDLGAAVDLPNYYYGYSNKITDNVDIDNPVNGRKPILTNNPAKQATLIQVVTESYPNEDEGWTWKTTKVNDNTKVVAAPGEHLDDLYDYQITYKYPDTGVDKEKRNTSVNNHNFHQYSQPTLFLGLSNKNFNYFGMQFYAHAKDSITRAYDNEWDFVMNQTRDYEASSRGLTLTWGKSPYKLAQDSYMLLLAGSGKMPKGLNITGIYTNGLVIDTDSGFRIFNRGDVDTALKDVGHYTTINTLGQAKTYTGASYQLLTYVSNDGNVTSTEKDPSAPDKEIITDTSNNSLHFGLTKKLRADKKMTLDWNMNPDCQGDRWMGSDGCSILGQLIFDPLNYVGGIGLGTGQGKNTKVGLVVTQDNQVVLKGNTSIDTGKVLSFTTQNIKGNDVPGVYMQLATDKNADGERGDLYIGTQIGGGANIRGVNGYYGKSLTLTGNANIKTDMNVDGVTNLNNAVNVAGITTLSKDVNINGVTNLNNAVNVAGNTSIDTGKVLSFTTQNIKGNDVPGVYMQLATDKNADGERGDLYIGTQIGGGANIRGVNGYYGKSLTLTGNANIKTDMNVDGVTNLNNAMNVAGITTLNNAVNVKGNTSIDTGKVLSFTTQNIKGNNVPGVYMQLAIDKNADGERGDLYIGTQIGGGANIRGVNGYYGKTMELMNSLSAPKVIAAQFHGELSTPSSSSEACNAGDFKDDANYHYVCVGTNKWKRVALSDF